ncbi:MAG: exodeoxyribonuclease VII large subunit, partial [Deltaproteobacteria bacterium]|nr:exodeoxyribonuclease VII large subunit [Deltaproteobacteria bacterium]
MKLDDLPLFSQQTQKVEPKKTDIAKSECFTVSELTAKIRETLEPVFTSIWVKGEVSNFRPASSGHVYFSLKDAGSTLPVACFNWNNRRKKSPFNLEDGMEILCHGKITVYSPRGSYQLIADQLEPVGAGALQLAFEQLKTKLNQEGLFDIKRKRALPLFPTRLVVITSPSGAAIQDILNILK